MTTQPNNATSRAMYQPSLPLGLFDACRAIAAGTLQARDYLHQCAAIADAREPQLHAFVTRMPTAELLAASSTGPWAGIPVAVKDLIDTAQFVTTYGSPIYAAHRPAQDAAIVAALRKQGAVVCGKTVTTEFAWRQNGPTVNPFHAEHTPGGSSSGSAAAVATGMVPLGLGTQTYGSIIRPAAYCGVVGFKASFGAVPRQGAFPVSGALDHVGFLARCVNDVALAFNVLRNQNTDEPDSIVVPPVPMDSHTGLPNRSAPKLAFLQTPFDDRVSAAQMQAMLQTVDRLRESGAVVQNFTLPQAYWDALPAMDCLVQAEGGHVHQPHAAHHADLCSVHIHEMVAQGGARSAFEYLSALALQQQLRRDACAQLQEVDAVLTVPATGEAPHGLGFTGDPLFCALWSFLGLPAITLPVARSQKGLPLGLQLVAPYRDDGALLRTARWVEHTLASHSAPVP
jgi:Asp-tRNA(Asn)/Glu-tRNA(Gln) amidotransferase A subunit family amidase